MPTKILRLGDKSDKGPNGEFGACFTVSDADGNESGVTVHCAVSHRHSRDCAIAALKAQTIKTGTRDTGAKDGDGNAIMEDVMKSPLEVKRAELQKLKAAKEAEPVVQFDPLPKRTVRRDGRDVQIEDGSVSAEELA